MTEQPAHILKNGAKRLRHGTYRCVYLDNHGKNKNGVPQYAWRWVNGK